MFFYYLTVEHVAVCTGSFELVGCLTSNLHNSCFMAIISGQPRQASQYQTLNTFCILLQQHMMDVAVAPTETL